MGMIRVAELTADEKWALTQHIKHSQIILVRQKAQAIIAAGEKITTPVIARIIGKQEQTVRVWLKAWNEIGMASIFSGHQNNLNASKLTAIQKEELKTALSVSPREYGIAREFWDVPTLKRYLSAEFDIKYDSPQAYHYYLKFAGLSFKYPDIFDRKRNEGHVKLRIQEIAAEIEKLRAEGCRIFCADEVRVQQEAEIRRAWLKKNQRTIVKVNRQKESQSYLGLLSQDNFRCFLYKLHWQNSKNIVSALKKFLESPEIAHANKPIVIIWDNASWHRSKEIKNELKQGSLLERIHLIAMPPYAPDENPIEHVWNTAKQHAANIQDDSFSETKTRFENFVRNKTFKYSFRGINKQYL